MFYSPDMGDLPDFDLPDDLELPNLAMVSYFELPDVQSMVNAVFPRERPKLSFSKYRH